MSKTTLIQIREADEEKLLAAVEMGNQASTTVGFLPIGAYRRAASDGHLLGAFRDNNLMGYALYGIARNRVRLTHLCVAPEWRGRHLAKEMVEWISAKHADSSGMRARCRHDYNLGDMWIALGFRRIGEKPGRSKEALPLVDWWLDHGHPNLFSVSSDEVVVRATFDLNILRDLVDPKRQDARDSLALVDDQASDRLALIKTSALDAEIDNIAGPLRQACTDQAQLFRHAEDSAQHVAAEVRAQIVARLADRGEELDTSQDGYDLRHVVSAVLAGASVFITRDQDLVRRYSEIALELFGVRTMHPANVIIHLDELSRAEAYKPAALLNTDYSRRLLGVSDEENILRLNGSDGAQRPRALQRLLRDLAVQGVERHGFFAPDEQLIAVHSLKVVGTVLEIQLLRVADHPMRDTVARQLLFALRKEAVDLGLSVLRLRDQYLSRAVRSAAHESGFIEGEAGPWAMTLDVCSSASEISQRAAEIASRIQEPQPPHLRPGLPRLAAADIETSWWPAKVLDSHLKSYLIPIQQSFSADLLGIPETMDRRADLLGLSREHVYYRSATPGADAPSRIVWYISETGASSPHFAGAVACSQLIEVAEGEPGDLYRRFRHLGVWTEAQLRGASTNGLVQAMVFANTELFARVVSRNELRDIAKRTKETHIPLRPLQISPTFFEAVYRKGRRLE